MRVYHTNFQTGASHSKQIEQLTEVSISKKLANLAQVCVKSCKDAGASLIHFMTRPNEIRVWQVVDRHGETCWKAYDPYTNTTSYLGSENDLRVWLEQRYSR
ncbi:MAG: hypothetical protein HC916_11675 [Coleofasciculaceae cyanobacterium SM2_1_6]|nr:hypothetical protein [Coleofasciculaceae cyanobacterium SM2_1_6]